MGTSQRYTGATCRAWRLLLVGSLAPACTVNVEPGAVVIELPGFAGSAGENGSAGSAGAGSSGAGGTTADAPEPDGGAAPDSDGGTAPDPDAGTAPDADGVAPTVNVLTPSAQQVLTTTNDCVPVGGGFGITVSGTTSAVAGAALDVTIGAGAPVSAPPVSAGAGGLNTFSACVAIGEGVNQTLTVTVVDEVNPPGSDSVVVSVDTLAPTNPVLAPAVAVTHRREGQLTFTWNHVSDSDGSALAGYEMRCASALISDEPGWSAARVLTVNSPGALLGQAAELIPSPTCSGAFCRGFRTGASEFCVVRGRDIAGALTPLAGAAGNVAVSVPFVSTPFSSVLNGNSSFTNVVALGDVNGDGADDLLYGVTPLGLQLYFGGAGFDTTADVSFGNGGVSAFGAVLASVGDVNGDGIPDFAASARALGGNSGTVYLFFGKASNTWPPSIVVNAGGCGADVCLVGSAAGAFFGWDITGTNFDGSGPSDLVISARTASGGVGAVYVILGGAQLNVPSGTSISVPGGNPSGFLITPPASRSNFGVALAAVGTGLDGRGDLVIAANGAGTTNPAALFYLQGEAYPGASSGLLAPSAPLLEVAVGSSGDYGAPVRAIGDFDGDGFGDLALGRGFSSGGGLGAAELYRRNEPLFAAGPGFRFDFSATGVDNDYATFIATGFHPSLGTVGDLDGDGKAELAIGSLAGSSGGSMALFYGAATISSRVRSSADFTFTGSATSLLVPNFVGDFDGDGFDDLAVVDGGSGTDRLILLH